MPRSMAKFTVDTIAQLSTETLLYKIMEAVTERLKLDIVDNLAHKSEL